MTSTLHLGDCLDVLRTMPNCSVDAVVTDPPYGLAFMGKRWDYDVPSVAIWEECLRVLKPGGHLLAFAGTRTQHRMAVRIEDAGFEIRDLIAWCYGSGFPKSLDVSKAIDKAAGVEREVLGQRVYGDGHVQNSTKLAPPIGTFQRTQDDRTETAPATPEAQQWAGWGTALKPALEPITMARKPLTGTVAANVIEHGTGALNVDGCRVGFAGEADERESKAKNQHGDFGSGPINRNVLHNQIAARSNYTSSGRWPANLIHDGSDEVVGLFPQTTSGTIAPHHQRRTAGGNGNTHGAMAGVLGSSFGDTGSAARFFYTAKCSKQDREQSTHPTMKPTDLMRYLCRLVTPPGGVVLDPFMGSGSTGKAAMLEGFGFFGIERDPSYHAIAEQRISRAQAAGHQPDLFAGVAA
jgi:site-specific DNA-methyltransferase (adenine-specific)